MRISVIVTLICLIDDVRNWSTQADPCMSLLDEWFATHNRREGTYAIHQMLIEINREDAAAIVKEALNNMGKTSFLNLHVCL